MKTGIAGAVRIATLAALAATTTVQAEDGLYGALMGSAVYRDTSLPVDTGYGFHGLIGGGLSPRLNWELGLNTTRVEFENAPGTISSLGFGADLNWALSDGRCRPFLLTGLGLQRDRIVTGARDIEELPFVNLGLGIMGPRDSAVPLRAEVRTYALFEEDYPGDNITLDVRLNVGLLFGGSAAAAAAAAPAAASPAPQPAAAAAAKAPAAAAVVDSDGDGVLDDSDRCPASPKGQKVDARGCADLSKLSLQGVGFANASDQLTPRATPVLDSAAAALLANPAIKVEVAGHTDSVGKAESNQKLSEKRANAVRAYLVKKGVAADRLSAKGYGASQPVDTNDTAAGRANNRRVDFKVQ